jgi:ABC-type phosphate/phosphonate transport system substrate-binding protein
MPKMWNDWKLAALIVVALVPGSVVGQDAKKDKDEVKVTVVSILATDRNTDVDPRVKCIADEVQKLEGHKNLTGFRQAKMTTQGMPIGKAMTINLVDNQQVSVTVLETADAEGKVRMTVKPPTLGNITYSTACGKCLPIVTRYKTKDNDLLIIAVMVKPCGK